MIKNKILYHVSRDVAEKMANKALELAGMKSPSKFVVDIVSIVDMPNHILLQMVKRVREGNGTLAAEYRNGIFSMLTDDEITRIEATYKKDNDK